MKVRTGSKLAGSSQFIEVELDDADMQDVEDFATKNTSEKFRLMTIRADLMVVKYLYQQGAISGEYAQQRIQEIQGSSQP